MPQRTGVVLRAMDRGISSANTVVRYLFLSLLPTVVECVVVCVIFLTHYSAGRVAVVAIGGVALYALVTYVLTAWRMKVRAPPVPQPAALMHGVSVCVRACVPVRACVCVPVRPPAGPAPHE